MPSEELSKADIRRYANRVGIQVDAEAIDDHRPAIQDNLTLLFELNDLPTNGAPPEREHWTPDEQEDPNAAFITRTDITSTGTGLLSGLSVGVKDNIAVAGVPMTCGSPLLEEYEPHRDATVVDRLLASGARILGKTNMDEFALGGSAEAMRFRLARNPHDETHQPGGSSAGSGVGVAEGTLDVALGTDTAGSVRFPASFCGVVGIKPSRGLVSMDGVVQFSKLLDTVGVLADSTATAARALQVISGSDSKDAFTAGVESQDYLAASKRGAADPGAALTLGIPETLFDVESDIETIVRDAVDRLAEAGATTKQVSIPDIEYAIPAWLGIGMTELAAAFEARGTNLWQPSRTDPAFVAALDQALEERAADLGDFVKGAILEGEHYFTDHGNEYYARAQIGRERVTAGVDAALAEVDVLATPTTPILPPEWGSGYLEDGSLFDQVRNTGPFNLTGHPAVTVPCGTAEGLPVGLQFVAPRMDDATAIRAAAAWEAVGGAAARVRPE